MTAGEPRDGLRTNEGQRQRDGGGGGNVPGDGDAGAHRRLRRSPTRRQLLAGLGAGLLGAGGISWWAMDSHGRHHASRLTVPVAPINIMWAHYIGQGLPFWDELDGSGYGDHYYLDMVHGDSSTTPRPTAFVPRAQAAGVGGMQILLGSSNKGTDFFSDWLPAADASWKSGSGFRLAPVLADLNRTQFLRMVSEYAVLAASHVSAARVDGRLVIFLFASGDTMSAREWASLREELKRRKLDVYLVGDIMPNMSRNSGQLANAWISPYLAVWDASWLWEADPLGIWDEVVELVNASGKPFFGGIMPGYNRETTAGAFYDARATARLRDQWEACAGLGLDSQVINTWNDLVEQTEIIPTSTWNTTRADVCQFYASSSTGQAFQSGEAQVYATSPKAMMVGGTILAEALVLNPTGQELRLQAEMVDGEGKTLHSATTSVAAHAAGAATLTEKLAASPAGHFVRLRAVLSDSQGRVVQQVTGAPTVVYPTKLWAELGLRRTYYSVPGRKSLPSTVKLSVGGDPRAATCTATVTCEQEGRFVDLLQNTRLVTRGYGSMMLSAKVPMTSGTKIAGGQTINNLAEGAYVARVIDDEERVAYSDPVIFFT